MCLVKNVGGRGLHSQSAPTQLVIIVYVFIAGSNYIMMILKTLKCHSSLCYEPWELLCVHSRSFFLLAKSDLQITELLGEVTLKESKKTQSDEYLRKLKSVLDSLPEGKDRLVNTSFWFCLMIL